MSEDTIANMEPNPNVTITNPAAETTTPACNMELSPSPMVTDEQETNECANQLVQQSVYIDPEALVSKARENLEI